MKFSVHWLILVPFLAWSACGAAETKAESTSLRILNLAEIAKNLRLDRFTDRKFNRKIKIAILDNGFLGYEQQVGKTLPANTQYHPGPKTEVDQHETTEMHGLLMAEIVAELIRQSRATEDYELHLFLTQGFTKFEDAVNTVAKDNFDLVLHSQIWEYHGNGDGKGFVNAVVNKATDAGVLWINSSGDFGHLTFMGPISSDKIQVKCTAPAKKKCHMRLVLSWNDFKDNIEEGTDKDLDLALEDLKGKVIQESQLRQKLKPNEGESQLSRFPRELIEADVEAGTFVARIRNISKNFTDQDQLRLVASGSGVEMIGFTAGETLMPPADNLSVIAVGASDQPQTSRSLKNKRPEVSFKSRLKLAGFNLAGHTAGTALEPSSSVAAALAAALAVLHLGIDTDRKREALISQLRLVSQPLANENEKDNPAVKRSSPKSTRAAPIVSLPPPVKKSEPEKTEPEREDQKKAELKKAELKRAELKKTQPKDLKEKIPLTARTRELATQRVPPPRLPASAATRRPLIRPALSPTCLPVAKLPSTHFGTDLVRRFDPLALPVRWGGNFAIVVHADVRRAFKLDSGLAVFATPAGYLNLTKAEISRGIPINFYRLLDASQVPVCR